MKGQSFVVTHALFIGFSVVFVLIVVATLSSLKDDYQEFIAKNEMKEVCLSIKSSVEKIYFTPSYTQLTNTTLGKIRILLPDKIADLRYRINFSGTTAFIDAQKFNDSCAVGFNNVIGYTTGGTTDIIFRSGNTIELVKV